MMLRYIGVPKNLPTFLAVIVTIGLLSIPVECSVAAGPHSIFSDAQAVARLQDVGAEGSGHGHHRARVDEPAVAPSADSAKATGDVYDQGLSNAAAHADHGSGVAEAPDPPDAPSGSRGSEAGPPRPAGIAGDAIVAISMPRFEPAPMVTGVLLDLLASVIIPPGHLLPGPEPPPP